MTFSAYETSRHDGTPAEHLEIVYGDDPSEVVRLTTADHDVTVNGEVYKSSYMKRDTVTDDANPYDGEQLKVSLQRDNPFADIYLEQDFRTVVTITVYQSHVDDPDAQPVIVWSGRLSGVEWEFPLMHLNSERLDLYMNGYALTMRFQVGQCVHTVYHGLCRLNKDDWEVPGLVCSVTDDTLIDIPDAAFMEDGTAYPDGYFTGGIFRLDGINRYILQHIGSQVWISRPIKALSPLSRVSLYPGCDRLPQTCSDKFQNIPNYLAFDWTPLRSGYDSSGVV